ncbi:MAG TPA: response regulator transcription factor [Saprospiraceae bacterium]|nr:response regulator transcription factor [Saprospiraceae bacterium]
MIRVMIADDHTMFVEGIESILEGMDNIQVVAKCHTGPEVFEKLAKSPADVILLDINLPGMNGIEVCQKLSKDFPEVKVLALSMHNEESFVTEILKYGALGYILKNTGKKELIQAIEMINSGQSYFSEEVTETIMKSLVNQRTGSKKTAMIAPKISRREKDVLDLIVKEYTTQEIADTLFISLKTVESHRRSLLTKLNVRNTAGLVRVAIENQLTKPA